MNNREGLKSNKFTLFFPNELEHEFQDYKLNKNKTLIRIEYLFIIFLYGIFYILDRIIVPEFSDLFFMIRYFIVIPILVTVIILSYFDFFRKIWQVAFSISFLFIAGGITIMIIKVPDNYSYYLGLMLVFSGNYFLSGLKFLNATVISIVNLIIFNLFFANFAGKDAVVLIAINFFYVSQNLINLFVAYVHERFSRENYILTKQLKQERENLELEVLNRTEELSKSELKFRTIANYTADWEYWIDKSNKIVFMSPSCERITGYQESEFIDNPQLISDLIVEDDLINWNKHELDIHNDEFSNSEHSLIFRIRNKYNKIIYLEHQCRPIYDKNENLNGRRISNRDVSERMSLELQLRKDQMFIKNILGSLPGIFLLYSYPEMKLILWNKNFEWLFGYTRDELQNKIGMEWFINKPKDKIQEKIDIIMQNGYYAKEEVVHTKFGDHLYYILSGKSFEFKDEKYMIGFGIDITEIKNAEIALIKTEEKQRAMIENIADVISILDSKLINKDISPNITSIFGWEINDILGFNTYEKIHPEDHEHIKQILEFIYDKPNKVVTSICRYKCKDETYKWIEFTAKNLLKDKIIDGFLVNFRDITERKKAEEEIILAKEQAEESNKLKSAFLDNVSHEIRTPINGIVGFLSYIKDYEVEQDEKEELITVVNQSLMRLIATMDSIVEVSQIQKGQISISRKEHNIHCLIDLIYDKYYPKAEAKGLIFEIFNEISNSESIIYTDSYKFNSAISNLVDNAIKFTKQGRISLFVYKENGNLIIKLEDTGIGIPESKFEKIFESFMQADVSNTRSFEGAGLGLTLSKAYIQMLGGKIWLESELGKGSTFWFSIPIRTQ